jgi:hypothetical protein
MIFKFFMWILFVFYFAERLVFFFVFKSNSLEGKSDGGMSRMRLPGWRRGDIWQFIATQPLWKEINDTIKIIKLKIYLKSLHNQTLKSQKDFYSTREERVYGTLTEDET